MITIETEVLEVLENLMLPPKGLTALILAGGLGLRIKPLVKHKPKVLIEVGGKPAIQWVADNLTKYPEVSEIWINWPLGNLPSPLYLPPVHCYYEDSPLGTAGTMKALENVFSDPFIVCNGDTPSNVEVQRMFGSHYVRSNDVTIFATQDFIRCGGTYIFSKRVLDFIPEDKVYSIKDDLIPDLMKRKEIKIGTFNSEGDWYFDIGTPRGLWRARKHFGEKVPAPKSFIECPKCREEGRENILGELRPEGEIVVARFNKALTKISGKSFSINCDRCGEKVFFRQENE